mgnify:CR=1 FL=1
MTYHFILFCIDAGLIVLMSLISFGLFLHDKKLALNQKIRVKEKTLLAFTVLNGAIGSLIGRVVAHHKTNKIYFSITIDFAFVCQIAVLILLGIFAFAF